MIGFVQARFDIGVAAVTGAVVLGLVSAPLERREIVQADTAAVDVQLQAVATQIAAITSTGSAPAPGAVTTSASETVGTANEAADPNKMLREFVFNALLPIGLAVAPFWYIGFPITLALVVAIFPFNQLSAMLWAFAPFAIPAFIADALFPRPTTTPTPAASARGAVAAGAQVAAPAVPGASPDAGSSDPKSESAAEFGRASNRKGAGRPIAERSSVTRPAAAQPPLKVAESASARRAASAIPQAASASPATKSDAQSAQNSQRATEVGKRAAHNR